jgi:hypothetical protein
MSSKNLFWEIPFAWNLYFYNPDEAECWVTQKFNYNVKWQKVSESSKYNDSIA